MALGFCLVTFFFLILVMGYVQAKCLFSFIFCEIVEVEGSWGVFLLNAKYRSRVLIRSGCVISGDWRHVSMAYTLGLFFYIDRPCI